MLEIKEINNKIRCDMPNCRNFAHVKLHKPGFLSMVGIYLCSDCMKEVYTLLAQKIVPKSPDNMLNKKIKRGKDISNEKTE